ncbi:hypothetical protein GGU11DRAFT_308867 [Lentinula aff. detonsa]|nr:hypothetical protein GGU11DRAFT_308867 [Lentinula aff. detonsa]
MSVLPHYAAPARLAAIGDALVGQKLRLVGRMMCYDSTTGFISLWDKEDALLVDVTLCLDPSANVWLQDNFCSIQVIGHLEKCSRTHRSRAAATLGQTASTRHTIRPASHKGHTCF